MGLRKGVRHGGVHGVVASEPDADRPPAPAMTPLYATHPKGLLRNAKVAKTLSMAFFSTAGTLWLYLGVVTRRRRRRRSFGSTPSQLEQRTSARPGQLVNVFSRPAERSDEESNQR